MAGPAEYGHYVLIFAWSLIVYGFGAQWMRFAYFGVYQTDRFGEYIASLARLLGAGITVVAIVLVALGLFGLFEPSFLVAVFALVCGITVYEAAFEVARTLLNVRGASLAMILRTVLMVGFGTVSLYLGGGARGLAIAHRRCPPHRRGAGACDFRQNPAIAFFPRRLVAHRQLRLAAVAVVRGHRARPEHRPAFARPLSRPRHARPLWRRRRRAAAELHRGRRGDHPVAGHGRQDASQPRRQRRRQSDAAKSVQCLPRRRELRRGLLHRIRRCRAASGAQSGLHRADPRSYPVFLPSPLHSPPCAISISRK